MSEILLSTALIMFAGYIAGKLFKGFNPFLVILGLLFLLYISPIFTGKDTSYFTYAIFAFGVILNFNRPVTRLKEWFADLLNLLNLRRYSANFASNIEQQKEQAEAELYRQKHEVEEELRRQKRQAEQDIERQRREAEEAIRKEQDSFRREQERARSNQNSNQQKAHSTQNDAGHLNPQKFSDACEILGLGQGCTIKEYKSAYMKLMKLYHPDKIAGLAGSRKRQAEHEAQQINAAWDTIKKKLK